MPARTEISAICASRPCPGSLTATLLTLAALFVVLFPAKNAAQAQAPATGEIKGTITDANKPLASARLSLANVHAGKSFKIKTDEYGRFLLQDAPYGYYELEVMSADGERLLKQQISVTPAGSARTATVNVDVSQSKMTSLPGDAEVYGTVRTLPEPNIKNDKKRNKAIESLVPSRRRRTRNLSAARRVARALSNWQQGTDCSNNPPQRAARNLTLRSFSGTKS